MTLSRNAAQELVQMKAPKQSSPLRIENASQAAVFNHPVQSRLLMACAKEERSLSQLQRKFGMSLSKLHYHVTKLLEVKLLAVSRIEPRGGRPVRHYRAVAEAFLVSQTSLAELPGDRWARTLRQSLRDTCSRQDDLSFLYGTDPSGNLLVQGTSAPAPAKPVRMKDIWRVLSLSAAQRAALAKEMMDLLDRYTHDAAGQSTEAFIVHAAFAPLPQVDPRRVEE